MKSGGCQIVPHAPPTPQKKLPSKSPVLLGLKQDKFTYTHKIVVNI